MQERITSIVVDADGHMPSSNRVRFCAHTFNPLDEAGMDGKIRKVTGLEAPSMDVTGGPSSFGGSVYTGLKTNDREVVLTVKPSETPVKTIKNRLNALVSRSILAPLRLRINTVLGDGSASGMQEDCYITGVSSPIFEADDTLQITLKLPRSFLERDPLIWGGQNPDDPVQYLVDSDITLIESRIVKIRPQTSELGSDLLNAPSPYRLALRFSSTATRLLKSVMFRDDTGNKALVSLEIAGSILRTTPYPELVVIYDSENRTITSLASHPEGGATDLRGERGYITTVDPGWPMLSPGFETSAVDITYESYYVAGVSESLVATEYMVWPRVFGI